MDDFKLIVWGLILVGYFIYNAIKKANKDKENRPSPPPASPQPTFAPQRHQKAEEEKSLDDIFSEVFGEQKAPVPAPKPIRPRGIEYEDAPLDSVPFEEGVSAFAKDKSPKKSDTPPHHHRKAKKHFNARQAFMYKELLDRKYKD